MQYWAKKYGSQNWEKNDVNFWSKSGDGGQLGGMGKFSPPGGGTPQSARIKPWDENEMFHRFDKYIRA